ncbi:bifunctional hydroxymethylpyrimidine kinase/phosphomethylpyrimidine kinase [Sphingomonas sp. LaA6.9]|uniref:bifunctional hydroxymethylpyrimidine kinase/phosphomethylpyrimidine kinase n=1 Tax=Sphingomonas sp. LaA6.9 TaxID=2919914 RepID=UPI001F4FAA50|nr:bifunctional hydroxymethylpyrimidine kinase/phosphomethylpyrimidine kinase [Sphingomonas sp. LaA6.9]MCJ8158397.1 bifunctional hydroxymethylpyrimidine kinase/phosphomethylpyrimidine kinase [Sphingomonas sp. LaA6.9]
MSDIARVLIIAGSDSGGGAGIQADIKTITMLGGHAMTAITAITAQNTLGVTGVHPVPADMVLAQIEAVVDDIGVDAVKIGMIGSAATANAVADYLPHDRSVPIVFDPVMVATSGSALADGETIAAFARLMDIATVVTPNLPELATLAQGDDPVQAALGLVSAHGCAVLIKGGHDEGDAIVDALIEEDNMTSWQDDRIETRDNHGTGCTLASAIALFLAEGRSLPDAVNRARRFVRLALRDAPGLGSGHGPMGQGNVRLDVGGEMRLNQITVGCDDYAASVDFYRALGLRLIVDNPPDYARFAAPGGVTFSIHRDDGQAAPGSATVYFECNDVDGEAARLARLGMPLEHGPIDQPWMWREARLRDPFGNMVCLYRAGEMRRYPPWRVA